VRRLNAIVGYHGYWVVLTYMALVAAVVGMCFALNGSLRYALICLMVSGVCDAFDGSVASLKERTAREKSYGIQLDSLADIVNFGVFPIIIGYSIWQSVGSFFIIHAAVFSIYVLAALIRLAHFNVIEIELQGTKEKRKYYEGLPVTSVALLVPVVYSVCDIFSFPLASVYPISLVVISLAFVLRVRIPKPRGYAIIILCLAGLPAIIYILIGKHL